MTRKTMKRLLISLPFILGLIVFVLTLDTYRHTTSNIIFNLIISPMWGFGICLVLALLIRASDDLNSFYKEWSNLYPDKKPTKQADLKYQLSFKEAELSEHLANENFEKAAKVRDELAKLRYKLERIK